MKHRHLSRFVTKHSGLTLALALCGWLSACGGGGVDTSLSSAALANPGGTGTVLHQAVVAPPPPPPAAAASQAGGPDAGLTPIQLLGKQIFNDPNLSEPAGTACVSCHRPGTGWADNHGSLIGVAQGSKPTSLGFRNALTNAYSASIPPFAFVTTPGGAIQARGGHFWDGRADTLAAQALGPFLNPLEMNNTNAAAVVTKIAGAPYAANFQAVFGASALSNPTTAFNQVGLALQAFEQTSRLQNFTSKYDAVVRGKATFSAAEQHGLALFQDRTRANCVGCHNMNPSSGNPADSPFTNAAYFATGIPRNTAIPSNANPNFFDLGLCGPARTAPTLPAGVNIADFCGKFRVPTLRNVAQRQRYMHNGFFTDLHDVVAFYSTRVSNPQHWYPVR